MLKIFSCAESLYFLAISSVSYRSYFVTRVGYANTMDKPTGSGK